MHDQSVTHWSSLDQLSTELINADDCIIPKQRGHGSQSVAMVQVTTMAVDSNLLVVGGFQGEVICKRLDDDGVVFSTRVTDDENAITNSLEIYQDPSGSRRLVAANNDCSIRIFDTEYFDLLKHYVFPWSVNSVSVSPNGKLFAVLGDHEDGLVVDPKCGKVTFMCICRLLNLQVISIWLMLTFKLHSFRQLVLLGATWIIHLRQPGIQTATLWPPGVKTLHAGCGT
jgi:WD40 repeat protein